MEGPKISVIIPVYNVEKYLPACLDSVIRQSYTSLELILVDDGSSDRSLEICRSYAERDDRIRVIRRDNGGASAARNTGLDHASGEYVSFVDSDDILFPDALEKLYQMVLREKTALAVGGILEWYKNRMRPITPIRGSFTVETEEAVRLALEGKKISLYMFGKLFQRQLFEKHRFIPDIIYEDAALLVPLIADLDRVAVTTEPLYSYRHHWDSTIGSGYSPKEDKIIEIYRSHLALIRARFPKAETAAEFRMYWAYFTLLDRMKGDRHPNGDKLRKEKEIEAFLRHNADSILRNRYFHRNRKLGLLVLFISEPLYAGLSRIQRKRAFALKM